MPLEIGGLGHLLKDVTGNMLHVLCHVDSVFFVEGEEERQKGKWDNDGRAFLIVG